MIKTNTTSSGHGPNLILVHGLGGNLHMWDEVVPLLTPHFTVWRYDLRGHGQSANPVGPWTLDDFVNDLQDVVRENLIDHPHVAGFSLGGLIVKGYCLGNPGAVNRLAIISAVAGRTERELDKVQQRIVNLEKGDLDTNIELALERWFSPTFRTEQPEKVGERLRMLKSNDPEGYLNAYRVFGLSDLSDQIHKIDRPTLVMTGEDDPGSNTRMAKLMHEKIKGSQLQILPGLRHSVLVEAPNLIGKKLLEFFRRSNP